MTYKAKRKSAMEHKPHPKPAHKTETPPKVEVKPAPPTTYVAGPFPKPEPKPEPKPVGPKLDDATLEECAQLVESYISRNTTQHTSRDLLAFEIASAIRAKKAAK